MENDERKAAQLIQEADKKLHSAKGFIGSLFGSGGARAEEAAELYHQAANLYKKHSKWNEAGKAFIRVSELKDSNVDVASNLVDAGNCFKKCDPNEAISVLGKAIDKFTDMGRFSIAAKHHQTIAEICETELADIGRCMQHYEKAADYYRADESNSAANKCILKVAEFAAQTKDYDRAIKIYHQVAQQSLNSSLLKYSAKDYFFKALLCHLCVDLVNTTLAMDEYKQMYPAFEDSREFKLIKSVVGHLEQENMDEFTSVVADYDSISRLDSWTTMMLNRVKQTIQEDLK